METVAPRRWFRVFIAVAILLLAQVTWWAMAFVRDVRLIATLEKQALQLSEKSHDARYQEELDRIYRESERHQIMFLSESAFFAVMACLGLYLLYRAIKLEERSRVIQRNFIEVVTHESKTPITALKLRLESIAAKWNHDEALSTEIGRGLEEVRRLSSIFEKALSLNRMERHAFTFEDLPLAEVVRAVVHRLDPLIRQKDVKVNLDLDSQAVVSADPYGLQSSVQSLLENAILYNDKPEKRVQVRVGREGNKVFMDVIDNGPGINENDRARIFERFYRSRFRRAPGVPGTGLGLYIARTIVEAHQGTIKLVENRAQGCCFRMELPLIKSS